MNVKAIEEIRKREASIINCEGEEKLMEVVAKIWDVNSDLIPVGAKYYTNSIDLRSVFETSSYNQTPKEYKPSEIIGEMAKGEIRLDGNYKTRDGREVRIYAVDGDEDYPIHGAIKRHKAWAQDAWTRLGAWQCDGIENDFDLIEIKEDLLKEFKLPEDFKTGIPLTDDNSNFPQTSSRMNRIDPNIQMQINALENAISRAQETIENLKNLK